MVMKFAQLLALEISVRRTSNISVVVVSSLHCTGTSFPAVPQLQPCSGRITLSTDWKVSLTGPVVGLLTEISNQRVSMLLRLVILLYRHLPPRK